MSEWRAKADVLAGISDEVPCFNPSGRDPVSMAGVKLQHEQFILKAVSLLTVFKNKEG